MPTTRAAALLALVACGGGTAASDRPIQHTAPPVQAQPRARTGLEFVVVDDGSPYMVRLYRHVGVEADGSASDPAAKALGIMADIDQWRDDQGARLHSDPFLMAHDRTEPVSADLARKAGCARPERCELAGAQVLQHYFDELFGRDPAFKPSSDRRIVIERVIPPAAAKDQRPYARTYYVLQDAELTGASVASAMPSFEPSTGQPIVLLDFDRAGAVKLGELTERIVGQKLAILVNGVVRSAPVINSAIRGGRASIAMGERDVEEAKRAAGELVQALRSMQVPETRP